MEERGRVTGCGGGGAAAGADGAGAGLGGGWAGAGRQGGGGGAPAAGAGAGAVLGGVCAAADRKGEAASATDFRNPRRPVGLVIWCECSIVRGVEVDDVRGFEFLSEQCQKGRRGEGGRRETEDRIAGWVGVAAGSGAAF